MKQATPYSPGSKCAVAVTYPAGIWAGNVKPYSVASIVTSVTDPLLKMLG
jgi:hypothetical protein